jgi:hypothetical protein
LKYRRTKLGDSNNIKGVEDVIKTINSSQVMIQISFLFSVNILAMEVMKTIFIWDLPL